MAVTPTRPIVTSFLVSRYLTRDARTGEHSVCGIITRVASLGFPSSMLLSCFVEMTDCQGEYVIRYEVRDDRDALLQEVPHPPGPLRLEDPLAIWSFCLCDFPVVFPRPCRYDLILHVNGEELARRKLFVVQLTNPPNAPKPA